MDSNTPKGFVDDTLSNQVEKSDREIECDGCEHVFSFKQIKISEKNIGTDKHGELLISYFNCPACGKEYVICVNDDWTLNKIKQIKQLNEKIQRMLKHMKGTVKTRHRRYLNQRTNMQQVILERQAELLKIYRGLGQ